MKIMKNMLLMTMLTGFMALQAATADLGENSEQSPKSFFAGEMLLRVAFGDLKDKSAEEILAVIENTPVYSPFDAAAQKYIINNYNYNKDRTQLQYRRNLLKSAIEIASQESCERLQAMASSLARMILNSGKSMPNTLQEQASQKIAELIRKMNLSTKKDADRPEEEDDNDENSGAQK